MNEFVELKTAISVIQKYLDEQKIECDKNFEINLTKSWDEEMDHGVLVDTMKNLSTMITLEKIINDFNDIINSKQSIKDN